MPPPLNPPMLPFLRPLPLPRSSTFRRFLTITHHQSSPATTTLTKSTKPPSPSKPTSPTTSSSSSKPTTPFHTALTTPRPGQSYKISRTPSEQLPVYPSSKRGGTLKQTCIKKVDGNVHVLRQQLMDYLGLGEREVDVNALTRHVWVKGHRVEKIKSYLQECGF